MNPCWQLNLEDEDLDDSEILTKTVIASVIDKEVPKGTAMCQSGSLMLNQAAESLRVDVIDKNTVKVVWEQQQWASC